MPRTSYDMGGALTVGYMAVVHQQKNHTKETRWRQCCVILTLAKSVPNDLAASTVALDRAAMETGLCGASR